MALGFTLYRRIARLRAPLLAAFLLTFAACDSTEPFNPDGSTLPDPAGQDLVAAPALASATFAGGIPIGHFAQPTTEYGARYNGGHQNIAPKRLVQELAAIKARGGKVVIPFAGSPRNYLDASGRFSFAKWKARLDLYKGINISSYAKDGTIIGHFMIDEPNDPANWNGQRVSTSMLEEMARYSKQLWPDIPTIVRAEPYYLSSNHRYLDAAWAQYLYRKGPVDAFIKRNVADAQQRGLQLIVGLNVLHGGNPQGTKMTASEVESWGSSLLSSSYPCAFISWTYNSSYLSTSSIKQAMDALRHRAQSRGSKRCG